MSETKRPYGLKFLTPEGEARMEGKELKPVPEPEHEADPVLDKITESLKKRFENMKAGRDGLSAFDLATIGLFLAPDDPAQDDIEKFLRRQVESSDAPSALEMAAIGLYLKLGRMGD